MQRNKKTSPVFWIALVGIGVAAYVFTTPQETAKSTSARRQNTKKTVVVGLITEQDRAAKRADFKQASAVVKNAFMPVIRKAGAGVTPGSPNILPATLTNGESGWTYTGTAAVDGRIQAVVENPGTGQGDFLSVGQRWKNAKVVAVTESSLILEGMDGQQITVKMQERLSSSSMVAGGFAPVNVNTGLRGPIGAVAVQPTPAPSGAVTGTTPGSPVAEGEGNEN